MKGPRIIPARRAIKFWSARGTGPTGTAIKAPAAMKAAKRAVRLILSSLFLEDAIVFVFSIIKEVNKEAGEDQETQI
jgi:hypothetical protein